MKNTQKWSDLSRRMISAVILASIGFLALFTPGPAFAILLCIIVALMQWEIVSILSPNRPGPALGAAILAMVSMLGLLWSPPIFFLILLLANLFMLYRAVGVHKNTLMLFSLWIWLSGYALWQTRDVFGPQTVLWLFLVVIATDVAGYFAGRLIGGPKFWKRVSPKKTWSGTVAGWIVSAGIGIGCIGLLPFSDMISSAWSLGFVIVVLSFSSQMGDAAESALKRFKKVKDASQILPGHGGLLDRFDGMIAASLVFWIIATFLGWA